ncbi:VOC family protein [Streptomyces sp. NPDC052225]|uniref:VOC family protein n=1 Tax=Streptomyces sp. NPDC052225 TaxID=3154949 RepID=UPI00343F7FED
MTRIDGAPARFKDLALDAVDHQSLADWWCAALGYVRRPLDSGEERPAAWPVPLVDPSGSAPLIWINPVAEAKTVKNRLHLDVWGDVRRLVELGASVVRRRDAEIDWDILADPEGNEFCVFTEPADAATDAPA